MKDPMRLIITLILTLLIVSCSNSTDPTDNGGNRITLSTYSLKVGDILRFEETASTYGSCAVIVDDTITAITGVPGAQVLEFDGRSRVTMLNNTLLEDNSMIDTIANFSSSKGSVFSTWGFPRLNSDGSVELFFGQLTCVNPDTLISIPAGTFRVQASEVRIVSDQSEGSRSSLGVWYVSPTYGLVAYTITEYAGPTPETGSPMWTSYWILKEIITK
jgi:hypothetical protein